MGSKDIVDAFVSSHNCGLILQSLQAACTSLALIDPRELTRQEKQALLRASKEYNRVFVETFVRSTPSAPQAA